MVKARIIPCLDVKDGRVVKGVRFAGLVDKGDPARRAALYEEGGADEIAILDVSATPEGRRTGLAVVEAVRRAVGIPVTVGGGVRTREDAVRLLEAGADKVAVNSAAVADPELLTRLADELGRQCVVLAIDAARSADGYEVVVRSGTTRTARDALSWCEEGTRCGAGEILLTAFDRDGTGEGYDTALLAAVAARVSVPVIASGGAKRAEHLAEALEAGASAVLAASIFHDDELTPLDVKRALALRGVEVRL